jgi:hypothetical protein
MSKFMFLDQNFPPGFMRKEGATTDSNHVLVARPGAVAADADVSPTPNVLGVTFGGDAESWLGNWQTGPDQVAVVSAGERSRTTTTATGEASPGTTDVVATVTGTVETVPDATDVAQVGTLVNDYLTAWQDEGPTTVYVEDVETLLDHVSAETAFRLLHALLSRAGTTNARLVVALDTADQPAHVAETFAELFDDVQG